MVLRKVGRWLYAAVALNALDTIFSWANRLSRHGTRRKVVCYEFLVLLVVLLPLSFCMVL